MNEQQERLQAMAAGVQDRVSGKLVDIRWAFMVRGVFAALFIFLALRLKKLKGRLDEMGISKSGPK